MMTNTESRVEGAEMTSVVAGTLLQLQAAAGFVLALVALHHLHQEDTGRLSEHQRDLET